MYAHPDCAFTDLAAVQRYLAGRNVEIVPGDIVTTYRRLQDERIVLSFIDTDNYSSASAALEAAQDRTEVGGATLFDHFTAVDPFRYTPVEPLAAPRPLDYPRHSHTHRPR